MANILQVSVTFLDPLPSFHGCSHDGKPEWPPSPLRVFQALVSASASHWPGEQFEKYVRPMLAWLQQLGAPIIVAPAYHVGIPLRISVPNNDMDVPALSWAKGQEPRKPHRPIDLKTMKTVCSTWLIQNDSSSDTGHIHYLFPVPADDVEFEKYRETLVTAARSITHLGWGIDMVAADAGVITEEEASALIGERWEPTTGGNGAVNLRTPIQGSLDDLVARHTAFLNRLPCDKDGKQSFNPVPPLSAFKIVGYRRTFDPSPQPFAIFSIQRPDDSGYRPFDTARYATIVAGMVRHALKRLAEQQRPFGWNEADIAAIVLGHAPDQEGRLVRGSPDEPRFAYLPLPSIERRGKDGRYVGMIRRVIVAGRPGMEDQIAWVRHALSGAELIDERTGEVKALLSSRTALDSVSRQYLQESSVWTTVTPVVVPGYDDRSGKKTDKLLRKALMQAGFSADLVQQAEIDWRGVGFLPGLDMASQYRRPCNIKEAPVLHVTIRWRDLHGQPLSIAGPVTIGSGRFRGLGLFVSNSEIPQKY